MTPHATVVVMTHNNRNTVIEAMRSVLDQTIDGVELIASDDHSTDGTDEVASAYAVQHGVRFVRHRSNLGQARHWSWALEQGAAPFVAVLHGDDSYTPNALSGALEAFSSDPLVDIVYSNYLRCRPGAFPQGEVALSDEDWTASGADAFRMFAARHPGLPSALFIRRAVLQRSGLPDPHFVMLSDREFFLRLALASKRVRRLRSVTTNYRTHDKSISATSLRNGVLVRELLSIGDRLRSTIADVDSAQKVSAAEVSLGIDALTQASAVELARLALRDMLKGDRGGGRAKMRQAWSLSPSNRLGLKAAVDYLLIETGDPLQLLPKLHTKMASGLVSAA